MSELQEILQKLEKDENATEEDYRAFMAGVDGDVESKKLVAQNIYKFIGKFPECQRRALHTQMKLVKDEDEQVQSFGVRNLFDLVICNPQKVIEKLVQLHNEAQGTVLTMVKSNFRSHLSNQNRIFLRNFIDVAKMAETSKENKLAMINIIKEYITFGKETKEFVCDVIDFAFEADPVIAIRFIMKYSELMTDHQRDDRLNKFFNDVYTGLNTEDIEQFTSTIQHSILPSISNIPFREGKAGQRLFAIAAELIFPKLSNTDEKWQYLTLRVFADAARYANEASATELVNSLYENLFTKIGSLFSSMLVIEPIFFLINTLLKKVPEHMVELFHIKFVQNGQKLAEDESKQAQLDLVLPYIKTEAPLKLDENEKSFSELNDEDKAKKQKSYEEFKNAATNCLNFAEAFSSEEPWSAKRPKNPSWAFANKERKPTKNQPKKGNKKFQLRNKDFERRDRPPRNERPPRNDRPPRGERTPRN